MERWNLLMPTMQRGRKKTDSSSCGFTVPCRRISLRVLSELEAHPATYGSALKTSSVTTRRPEPFNLTTSYAPRSDKTVDDYSQELKSIADLILKYLVVFVIQTKIILISQSCLQDPQLASFLVILPIIEDTDVLISTQERSLSRDMSISMKKSFLTLHQ